MRTAFVIVDFVKEIFMSYVRFGRFLKKTALAPFKYLGIVLLATVAFLSFAQNLPIPGNFKSLVVMSGSMEPKIHVGSVAIVKPSENIQTGDIITFKDPRDPKNLITHRIVEIGENQVIKTKGDANNTADNWEVSKNDIVGKFLFSIPLLGYTVDFAKRPQGFLLLILFPAILIIVSEIWAIKKELNTKSAKVTNTKGVKESKGALAATAISAVLLTFAFSSGKTLALLSDTETSSGNTISAGVWDVAESCVVLNEILPNPEGDDGQSGLNGEWVELYNKCGTAFDVSGWYIEYASTSGNRQTISSSTTHNGQTVLGAQGSGSEWLVLFMNGEILNNTGDTVTLYNGGGEEVDSHQFTADPGDEGKSFARIPDGTDNWVDPIPTPGGPNKLEFLVEEEQKSELESVESKEEPKSEPEPESKPDADDVVAELALPEATESAQPKETEQ